MTYINARHRAEIMTVIMIFREIVVQRSAVRGVERLRRGFEERFGA